MAQLPAHTVTLPFPAIAHYQRELRQAGRRRRGGCRCRRGDAMLASRRDLTPSGLPRRFGARAPTLLALVIEHHLSVVVHDGADPAHRRLTLEAPPRNRGGRASTIGCGGPL